MQRHHGPPPSGTEPRHRLRAVTRFGTGVALMILVGCGWPGERTEGSGSEAGTASTATTTAVETGATDDAIEASGPTATGTTAAAASGPDDGHGAADDGDAETETETATVTGRAVAGGSTSPSTSTPGSTPTRAQTQPRGSTVDVETLTGDDLEDFLASRYEAFWQAFGQARAAPTPTPASDFPALAELAAGEQLEQANAEIIELANDGWAIRAPQTPAVPGLDIDTAHRVRIERIDDTMAELAACFVHDRISYQVADGAIISDAVVTVLAEATMVRTDGIWRLARSRAVALDPGVAGCWLEGETAYPR